MRADPLCACVPLSPLTQCLGAMGFELGVMRIGCQVCHQHWLTFGRKPRETGMAKLAQMFGCCLSIWEGFG